MSLKIKLELELVTNFIFSYNKPQSTTQNFLSLSTFNVILIKLSQRLPLSIMNKNMRSAVAHMINGLLGTPSVPKHEVASD